MNSTLGGENLDYSPDGYGRDGSGGVLDGGGGGVDLGGGGSGGGGGGAGGPADAPSTAVMADLQLDEGGNLVIAYGQHVVAGHLVQYDYSVGPPPALKFIAALGEGPWDGAIKVYYAGEEISASASSSTPGYKFHPGTFSTGTGDANQGTPMFFPSSPTYSGTSYVEVLLSATQSVEERPDKMRGVFRCLKVANYNSSGTVTDSGSYSANPARVAADLLKRAGLLSLIDWPSWVAWRDYCDVTITWGSRSIPRFECHLALTNPTDIIGTLTQVTQTSCTFWQDTGAKIKFLLPVVTSSLTNGNEQITFTESNCRSVTLIANDRRALPTGYIARFRDLDDEYMGEVTVEVFSDTLETVTGGQNRSEFALPPMTRSQAERVCNWRLQLDGVYNADVELIAYGSASAILPGDLAKIDHEVLQNSNAPVSWLFITEAEDLPEESGPSLRRVRGRILSDGLYSDTAHTVPVS